MISRRMRMIDVRRVSRGIRRWLLSHLTALCTIVRANTSTRVNRKQYRALGTLMPNITFHSAATSVKNVYECVYKLLRSLIECTRRRQSLQIIEGLLHLCRLAMFLFHIAFNLLYTDPFVFIIL